MTTLVRGARWVAAACLFVVGAPIALLMLVFYLVPLSWPGCSSRSSS